MCHYIHTPIYQCFPRSSSFCGNAAGKLLCFALLFFNVSEMINASDSARWQISKVCQLSQAFPCLELECSGMELQEWTVSLVTVYTMFMGKVLHFSAWQHFSLLSKLSSFLLNRNKIVPTGYETSHMIFILLIVHMLLTCVPRSAAPSRDISFLGSPALSSPAPFAPPHNAGAPQLPSSSHPPSSSPPPSEQNKHFVCSIFSQYSDKRHQKIEFVKRKLPFAPRPPWPVPKTPPCWFSSSPPVHLSSRKQFPLPKRWGKRTSQSRLQARGQSPQYPDVSLELF